MTLPPPRPKLPLFRYDPATGQVTLEPGLTVSPDTPRPFFPRLLRGGRRTPPRHTGSRPRLHVIRGGKT